MKEKLIFQLASIFRQTPHFRGKFRLGTAIQKAVMGSQPFQTPHPLIEMKNNFRLRVDVRNRTDAVAFWCGIYDSDLINKFTSLFEQDWVVLDIGANIGYYAIPFAKKAESVNASIHAFEPLTANFESLSVNKDQNQCSSLSVYKFGLGEKKEKLGLALTEEGDTGNAVLTNAVLEEERGFFPTEYVEIDTLDSFYQQSGLKSCNFIKVDIEGAEIFFIRGAKETIRKHRPIIYGEFNPYFIEKNGMSLKEVWDFFQELDYDVYQQNANAVRMASFSPVPQYQNKISDLLLIPRETPAATVKKWIS